MKKILIIMTLSVILLTGCSDNKEKENTYIIVSTEEATTMLQNNRDVIILDVRSELEYNDGHIENAINMEYGLIKNHFSTEVTSDLDSVIIVYCQSGARAKIASNELIELGYKNVFTLDSWEKEEDNIKY